jgi:flagellar basal body-associated protein FliL
MMDENAQNNSEKIESRKRKDRKIIIIIAVCVVLCIGCVVALTIIILNNTTIVNQLDIGSSAMMDLSTLMEKLGEEYPAEAINAKIYTNHILEVEIINSPYNQLSEENRKSKAEEIAGFVKDNYDSIELIDTIRITLKDQQQLLGISSYRFWQYHFEVNQLE